MYVCILILYISPTSNGSTKRPYGHTVGHHSETDPAYRPLQALKVSMSEALTLRSVDLLYQGTALLQSINSDFHSRTHVLYMYVHKYNTVCMWYMYHSILYVWDEQKLFKSINTKS